MVSKNEFHKKHSTGDTDFSVAVIMGSTSDWPIMKGACEILDQFKVPYVKRVLSAHRNPIELHQFIASAESSKVKIFIAGAGGAAHLPGVIASLTCKPVIGVPIKTDLSGGLDSLLSIVQMPKGIPVATVAVNGAHNAALLSIQMLAIENHKIQNAFFNYRKSVTENLKKNSEMHSENLSNNYTDNYTEK